MIQYVLVLSQLRDAGLLSLCRITKQGYPVTVAFDHFCERYDFLYPEIRAENPPGRRGACQILKQLSLELENKTIGFNNYFLENSKNFLNF